MNPVPLKFRSEFENNFGDSQDGFKPFRDGAGRHIRRIVEMTPTPNRYGAYLIFKIIDVVVDDTHTYEKMIHSWEIQSVHAYVHFKEKAQLEASGCLIPNFDQAEKMVALAKGEITGFYAETVSNQLFFQLLIEKNEQSKFSHYLPDVMEWYNRTFSDHEVVLDGGHEHSNDIKI